VTVYEESVLRVPSDGGLMLLPHLIEHLLPSNSIRHTSCKQTLAADLQKVATTAEQTKDTLHTFDSLLYTFTL
jgi:hypothetical protein